MTPQACNAAIVFVLTRGVPRSVRDWRPCFTGKASAPLLPQLAQSLPDWFEGTRHSSFLYVASELVKVFGKDPTHRQQLGAQLLIDVILTLSCLLELPCSIPRECCHSPSRTSGCFLSECQTRKAGQAVPVLGSWPR